MTRPPVDFVFLCSNRFEALPGDDALVRVCPACETRVTNLDALRDDERDAFLALSDRCGDELCVQATLAGARGCGEYMAPGTYTGRTAADWRRIDDGSRYPREGESLEDCVRRVEAERVADRARIDVLLDEVRARLRRGEAR